MDSPRLGLGVKLALALVGSLTVLLTLLGFIFIRQERRSHEQLLLQSEDQLGDLMRGATRAAMLRNDREELEAQLLDLGRLPQVERVRIYDKTGAIRYSSDPGEIGTRVDLTADACDRCHASAKPLTRLDRPDRLRIYRAGGRRVMGMIYPVTNGPDCAGSDCHVHSPAQAILGVLDVQMSLAQADEIVAAGTRSFVLAAILALLAVSFLSIVWVWRTVHRPVRHLILATRAISAGRLDQKVPEQADSDLSNLVRSFNQMVADLQAARSEADTWARTLERRVEEKSAALGRAQDEMVQVEKMASLGKLAAIVAHEINNPLAGIRTYAKLLLKRMARPSGDGAGGDPGADETRDWLARIESEAARCGEIVRNLLAFSRHSEPRIEPVDLNEIVGQSLRLIQHQCHLGSVHVEWSPAPDLPNVEGDPQQIKQALLAVFMNACEAMPQGGTLSVACRCPRPLVGASDPAGVEVAVRDTGVGMDPETRKHLFEPFFTTKDGSATGGTGLGLAVVYSIMQSHGGNVTADSTPGRGSLFTLAFPLHRTGRTKEGSPA